MIGQFHAEEQEPTAKREICCACGKPHIPHDNFDSGPICRHCWSSATEIRLEAVIGGRTYVKHLRNLRAIEPLKTKAGSSQPAEKRR